MRNKQYWEELSEEYNKSLPTEQGDIMLWYEDYTQKITKLIEDFGEISWQINDLAHALNNEKISNSRFRELVRFLLSKHFKK